MGLPFIVGFGSFEVLKQIGLEGITLILVYLVIWAGVYFIIFIMPMVRKKLFLRRLRKALEGHQEIFKKKLHTMLQWHTCEHKLDNLLREGKEVTIESLREAPSISPLCETLRYGLKQEDFLAEPTEEQLKATLKVAQEYHKILSTIKNESN